jgi:hypothetical protein
VQSELEIVRHWFQQTEVSNVALKDTKGAIEESAKRTAHQLLDAERQLAKTRTRYGLRLSQRSKSPRQRRGSIESSWRRSKLVSSSCKTGFIDFKRN